MASITKITATFDDGSTADLFPVAPAPVVADPVVEVDTKTASGAEETFVPKV